MLRTHTPASGRSLRVLALSICLSLCASPVHDAVAGNADLDTTYIFGGGFIRSFSELPTRSAVGVLRPDGALLIAGTAQAQAYAPTDLGIARHLVDGDVDYSYGPSSGQLVYDAFYMKNDEVSFVADADVGTYLGGRTLDGAVPSMTLARITHGGAPDYTFASNGRISVSMGSGAAANAIAVQPDGKVLLLGYSLNASGKKDAAIVRVLPSGALDQTFGVGGKVSLPMSTDHDEVRGAVVRDDGSIVLAIDSRVGTQNYTDVVALNSGGDLVPGFGSNGIVRLARTGYGLYARGIAMDTQGRLVVASHALQYSPYVQGMNMTRLNANGTLDAGYNGSGHLFTTLAPGGNYSVQALELLPTGEAIVVGGLHIPTSGTRTIFSARFTAAGTLDTAYNNGVGYKLGDVGGGSHYDVSAQYLAVAADGRVHVGGRIDGAMFNLRYQGDALDLLPAAMAFPTAYNIPRITQITSPAVTVSGLSAGARVPIHVTGGAYSINGAAQTTQPGTVTNGDSIRLIHMSSSAYASTVTTTVTIGGLSPANNRSHVIGQRMQASFSSITVQQSGGGVSEN